MKSFQDKLADQQTSEILDILSQILLGADLMNFIKRVEIIYWVREMTMLLKDKSQLAMTTKYWSFFVENDADHNFED